VKRNKIPDTIEERLLELANASNNSVVQAQRPAHQRRPPPDGRAKLPSEDARSSSVPRDVFEDDIVPIFSTVGPIYETRLMDD
jgi:hypothetical protein